MTVETRPVDEVIKLGEQLQAKVQAQRAALAGIETNRHLARESPRKDDRDAARLTAIVHVLQHALTNCEKTLDALEQTTGFNGRELADSHGTPSPPATVVHKDRNYSSFGGNWFKVSHGFTEGVSPSDRHKCYAINMDYDRLWLNARGRIHDHIDRSTTPWSYSRKRKHREQAKRDLATMALALAELERETVRQETKLEQLAAAHEEDKRKSERFFDDQASGVRETAEKSIQKSLFELYDAMDLLPPVASPWDSPKWKDWQAEDLESRVLVGSSRTERYGQLGKHSDLGIGMEIPVFRDPLAGLHLVGVGDGREAANGLARSIILRTLTAFRPGMLQLTLFDPVGMGQSAQSLLEIAEYNRDLIGGKVWSSAEDLRQQLTSVSAHIEMATQKYLRSQFGTLEEFNQAAGDAAEPYRLLVVFDFPSNFEKDSFDELVRIAHNGPRCGVGVLLVSPSNPEMPHGTSINQLQMPQLPVNGTIEQSSSLRMKFESDSDLNADPEVIASIVRSVAEASQSSGKGTVDFDESIEKSNPEVSATDPETWWRESSVGGITAPIGQAGARDVTALTLDSTDHAGALLVGRPGSGKSTLLHAYLAGITTLYSPEELELHLIDFKEGVEFKGYAATGLPHAVSVAIESDREFGLSVLNAIQAEISRRANLLRDTDGAHSSLPTLREKTGEKLPRILLVFDEFQVLFSRNDKVGDAAAVALESIIRQGRGFGVHVLLASQSLSGLDALGSHVPQLLPVRILLPASEGDSTKVLAEGNRDWQLLSKAGEGILNASGGIVEANQPFRGIFLSEEERQERLHALREKADRSDLTRHPIVFEGNAPIPADNVPPDQFIDEVTDVSPHSAILRFGAPMAITGASDVILRREGGSNVMLIARDPTVALGSAFDEFSLPRAVTVNSIGSAIAKRIRVEVVDFMAIEQGLEAPLEQFLVADLLSLSRKRQVPALLAEIDDEVRTRVEADDTAAPPILLVLYGLHRAMDFDMEAMDFDTEEDLPGKLSHILVNGPEVGVHVFGWSESLSGLTRRLPSSALREFSWRLASQMSVDDSHSFVGSDAAHGMRPQQLLLTNEDLGVFQKVTAYSSPSSGWTASLIGSLAGVGSG